MYVVLEGHVEVTVPRPGGAPVRVATLGPGEVVGEISLLTGEPRSADVHALDEVEVLEVGKAAMAEVLAQNEALFGALTEQAGRRAGERSEAVARHETVAGAADSSGSLLQRMKRFFGAG
jgi:CRP-like cAMP-binding protein